MEKLYLNYKSELFIAICVLVLVYFVYHLTLHILKTLKRNRFINATHKAMLKANEEFEQVKDELITEISAVYNPELAENVSNKKMWIGMPRNLLLIARGVPDDVKNSYYQNTVIQKCYYGVYKTLLNNKRYRLEVTLENDEVVSWTDL